MKIKVIGSGCIWTKYASASYLIDNKILIDIPNGCMKKMMEFGINPEEIEYLLITHFHGDHYFDIPFYLMYKSKHDNKINNVYLNEESIDKVKSLTYLAFPNSCEEIINDSNVVFHDDLKFQINEYIIDKVLVDHGGMKPAYGYIFSDSKIKVGFTGDSALCEMIEMMASVCKYLILDISFIEGTSKHMGIDNLKYLVNTYSNCTFIPSHMSDEVRDTLTKMKLKNVIIVQDGEELTC